MEIITEKELIFLFGAGASADAGIPITFQMLEDVEGELESSWKDYKKLYEYIREKQKSNFNIESLVSTLDELIDLFEKKHALSPFFESWLHLLESISINFELIKDFRKNILRRLKEKWIIPSNYKKAAYFKKLVPFMLDVHNDNLHIFTLNYDLCIENACAKWDGKDIHIERGFGSKDDENIDWDWNYFQEIDNTETRKISLYKLHGSIDWTRENGKLISSEVQSIIPDQLEIIFGEKQKLKSADPYLFLIYEFREFTLNTKTMIICGYSFGDSHINEIIGQSISQNRLKKLVINFYRDINGEETDKAFILSKLKVSNEFVDRLEIVYGNAPNFLDKVLTKDFIGNLFPNEQDLPFDSFFELPPDQANGEQQTTWESDEISNEGGFNLPAL